MFFFVIYELMILYYYDFNVNLSWFFFYPEPDPRFLKWIRLDPDSQHCKNQWLQYMTPRSGSPIPFDESHVNIFIWFRAHVGPVRSLVAVNKFLVSGDNASELYYIIMKSLKKKGKFKINCKKKNLKKNLKRI